MAILSVKERAGRRHQVDRENVRNWTRKFLVRCDVPDQSLTSIRIHPSIPKPWSAHPEDPFAFADVPAINQRKNKYWYDVEVDYTTRIDGDEKPKNPLEWPAEIDWNSQEFQRIAVLDRDGQPILNTADDPPQGGGLAVEDAFWVIAIEKNLPGVPKKIVTEEYAAAVNQDTVRVDGITFPPNTLKLKRIRISRWQRDEGIRYRRLSLELHSRPQTWTQTMLNRGYSQLVKFKTTDDAGNAVERTRKEKILVGGDDGRSGEPPSEPAFLDPQGRYIEKPSRQIRFVKGGTVETLKPLPDDPDEKEKELKRRSAIVVLTWDVEKQKPFRGVLPLA